MCVCVCACVGEGATKISSTYSECAVLSPAGVASGGLAWARTSSGPGAHVTSVPARPSLAASCRCTRARLAREGEVRVSPSSLEGQAPACRRLPVTLGPLSPEGPPPLRVRSPAALTLPYVVVGAGRGGGRVLCGAKRSSAAPPCPPPRVCAYVGTHMIRHVPNLLAFVCVCVMDPPLPHWCPLLAKHV